MNKFLSLDDSEEFLKLTDKPYSIPNKDNFLEPEFLNQEQEEEYQLLLRSIGWIDGFGLFFVECIPKQAERLIKRLKSDIPKKQIEVLKFTQPVDNLYNIVNDLPDRDNINILCIQGLEYSLNEYIKPGFGGEGDYYKEDSVPRILSHLNFQREKFRDSFNICFVFLLPKFAVKYFIRRAPDFYDWRSGTFEFSTDRDILAEVLQVIDKDIKEKDFAGLNFDQCRENILQIDSVLEEDYQDLHKKADLFFKKGVLLLKVNLPKDAVHCYNQALAINDKLGKVWYYRGLALFVSQRLEESIICFDRVLELETANQNYNIYAVYTLRGLALLSLGLLEEALTSIDKALDLKSNDYQLWQLKAKLLNNLERHEEALSSIDNALDLKSDDYELWQLRSAVLTILERHEEALSSIDKVLDLKADDYQSWQIKAKLLGNLERYEEALNSVGKALELKADDYKIWQLQANLLGNLERYEEALNSVGKTLELKAD
ncbi:tetratricopeptide repeat protein, partial [Aphanizomenon flos-aquae]|uniref:tetratricopeptide repeat protein n=1 Tax=Aphanizomenon flos-aquae TaxID=1176 RepID=UPI00126914B2